MRGAIRGAPLAEPTGRASHAHDRDVATIEPSATIEPFASAFLGYSVAGHAYTHG
jgi:hypothetical protein